MVWVFSGNLFIKISNLSQAVPWLSLTAWPGGVD